MPFKNPGQIFTFDQPLSFVRHKIEALLRDLNRRKRCRRCYYWNPGDGSQPNMGLCCFNPPTVFMRTQAMWSKGVPADQDPESKWIGLKNAPESAPAMTNAESYCRHFTRHRLISGWWGIRD